MRKTTFLFFLILVSAFGAVTVNAQTVNETLQHRSTNFTTPSFFNPLQDVEINTTLGVMQLSGVPPVSPYENFTSDWVETDISGSVSIQGDTQVTYDGNMRNNLNSWLTRTVAPNRVFEYQFKLNVDTLIANAWTSRGTIFGVTNVTEDYIFVRNSGNQGIFVNLRVDGSSTTQYSISLFIVDQAGTTNLGTTGFMSVDTDYWLTFNRTGFDIGVYVFNDEAKTSFRTNGSGDASVRFLSDYKFTRLFATQNLGVATNLDSKLSVSDLNLGIAGAGFETSGIAYSVNLLHNTTLNAYHLLFNTSISHGGIIRISASGDNATWFSLINITDTSTRYVEVIKYKWTDMYVRIVFNGGGFFTPQLDTFGWTYQTIGDAPCPPSGELDGVWREYNVSSITVIDGTYDSGQLNSTAFVDGNLYRVNESVGVDPLEVRFNFSGIPEDALSLSFRAYCEYEGNPAHIINLQAWNFEDSSWDTFFILVEHGFRWYNASLSIGDYIEDGKVWLRWDHVSNGASGHYLTVDYLKLRAFVPVGENVDAWSINWLTSLIWLGLLAIGTSKDSGTLTVFAGFFGLVLGLLMLGTNSMVAISLILLNLYLIYTGSS